MYFLTSHYSLYLYTCQPYDISSWLSNQSGTWWYVVIAKKMCTYRYNGMHWRI